MSLPMVPLQVNNLASNEDIWKQIAELSDTKTKMVLATVSKTVRGAVLTVATRQLRTNELGTLLLTKMENQKTLLQLL